MKMEKTPRYTQRERNMVLGYAAQYKDVIENKRTDAESNRKKDEVWRQIAKEFNARVYHQRSSKQLRQLYKNMKLLLKKDLCGEGKGNRSFMDLLNTLSQQESVAQYISEQMSPSGYSSSRQQKFDDEFDDSKLPSGGFDGIDTDVIVIKSEDISDNEHSHNEGNNDDMDDDDDDCLSPKDIPEVCLEEEDDEIFATDLRQTQRQLNQRRELNSHDQQTQQQPEITIQNIGGIRVGSIGSLANLKALQNAKNSTLCVSQADGTNNNNNNNNNNTNNNNNNNSSNNDNSNSNNNNNRCSSNSNSNGGSNAHKLTAEQAQQHLLLNGLGLSAVNPIEGSNVLPTLQRGMHSNANSTTNQLFLNLSNSNYGDKTTDVGNVNINNLRAFSEGASSNYNIHKDNRNDYLMSLAIEERRRKIDLINAQIEYWKTLTKKLDSTVGSSPPPTCLCHYPGKVNGLQAHTSS